MALVAGWEVEGSYGERGSTRVVVRPGVDHWLPGTLLHRDTVPVGMPNAGRLGLPRKKRCGVEECKAGVVLPS